MNDESVPHNVRLAAAKDLLDRAQVSGKQTVELEIPAWQQLLDGIVATVPTDGAAVPARMFAEAEPAPDPLVIEAARADDEDELARFQEEPEVHEHFHPEAYGSDGPPAPPQSSRPPAAPRPTATPPRDGNPRPPRPRWERDAEVERRRRDPEFAGDVDHPPPHGDDYRRSGPPRRGRVAGHRR